MHIFFLEMEGVFSYKIGPFLFSSHFHHHNKEQISLNISHDVNWGTNGKIRRVLVGFDTEIQYY